MPFRSLLFTPAARFDRLPNASAAGADWDALEDGVGAGGKAAALDAPVLARARWITDSMDRSEE